MSRANAQFSSEIRKYSFNALAAVIMALAAVPSAQAAGSSSIVRNLQTGQCLYPTSAGVGTAIYQAHCDASDNRSFGIEYVGMQGREVSVQKASFRLRNVQTNMCVDLANNSNGNGVPVVQNPCNGSPTQQWSTRGPLGLANYHQLVNGSGGKCLDAAMNASHIQLWQCGNGNNQSWWAAY